MKASIRFILILSCVVACLLACGSSSWKTQGKIHEAASWVAAEFTIELGMKFVLMPAGTFIMGSPIS